MKALQRYESIKDTPVKNDNGNLCLEGDVEDLEKKFEVLETLVKKALDRISLCIEYNSERLPCDIEIEIKEAVETARRESELLK